MSNDKENIEQEKVNKKSWAMVNQTLWTNLLTQSTSYKLQVY